MPLAFKPIFINMDLVHESSTLLGLIIVHKWDLCKLNDFFGPLFADFVSKIDLPGFPNLNGQPSTEAAYVLLVSEYAYDHS